MGTPYYHTDESATQTIQDYADLHGLSFTDALHDMGFCYDDLDNQDRSAYNYYFDKLDQERMA
jgi:hypothetical protein